jgi:phospholipase C
MPMVIVSPYAKPHYTDSRRATFASMLAFTEHVFGLPALSVRDSAAYDYGDAFDFGHPDLKRVEMTRTRIPLRERRYLRRHRADPDDPT